MKYGLSMRESSSMHGIFGNIIYELPLQNNMQGYMNEKRKKLGYIGLGNMGGPMAVLLAKVGFEVNVFGRNKSRLKPALSAGAIERSSAKEVAENSDIVFLCLTDTAAVDHVVFGTNGIASGARSGSILIDMSTISPKATIEMSGRLAATGMNWIDAPVSGGTVGATNGTLNIFAGGSLSDFNAALPALETVGRNITLMGPVGAGQNTKLVNQIILSCTVAVLAEACAFAERVGLDLSAMPKALAGGRADSTSLQHYWPRLATRDFTSHSTLASIVKDIHIIQDTGRPVGALLPISSAVNELYKTLVNAGYAGDDLTALARLFAIPRDNAGLK
jgi:3-hydroxyisobutyrate dehydrogenase